MTFDHPPVADGGTETELSNAEVIAFELMHKLKQEAPNDFLLEGINSQTGESTIIDSAGMFKVPSGGDA